MDGYLLGRTTKVTTRWYRGDFPLNGSWLVIEATSQMEELARLNLKVTEVKRFYRPGNTSPYPFFIALTLDQLQVKDKMQLSGAVA